MCVAVLIETAKGPTEREIRLMYEDNPHGAGLAWGSGDLVRYRKGLSVQQVIDLLPTLPRPVLLHFRWATHGGTDRVMTHPFPIGRRAITSRKLNGAARAVLIHNGVWHDYERFAPPGCNTDYWSDTAVAAWAAGEYGEDILDHVNWATAVGRAAGNGRLDITLRGTWEEWQGNQYSNLLWQPKPKVRMAPGLGLSFLRDGDAWSEYFARKELEALEGEACNERFNAYGRQVSHSAYDDDPIGLLATVDHDPSMPDSEDFDYDWSADGRLIRVKRPARTLGTLDNGLAPPESIPTWLEEFDAANEACALEVRKQSIADLVQKRGRK